jgi:argininosuccinate lyase
MKLWNKSNTTTAESVERFTVGRDREFDLLLARFDVEGSIAHVTMLGEVGLMTKEEVTISVEGLKKILKKIEEGLFQIDEGVEDVHSQVEFMLTEMIGETGKKIHTGRSRNDQVATDIKLFLKAEIKEIVEKVKIFFDVLLEQSEKHRKKLIPGYTHLQLAMPSSAGLWMSAYAESLIDDLEMLASSFRIVNKNPLGSGAGYGSSLPLNRTLTTELLSFSTLNYNSVYAQMTRGKCEKAVAFGLASISATLSKLSMDCCLYLNQNFGFISFPDELTTGSSIMPHKKNPDVFELIRAKCNRIQAVPNELTLLINNLPSGYHRDLQLTKEILFPAIKEIKDCLEMIALMFNNIEVNEDLLKEEKYKYLFSVDAVNQLVQQGVYFRDAYRQVGDDIEKGTFHAPNPELEKEDWHEGSIGRLCLKEISEQMNNTISRFQ